MKRFLLHLIIFLTALTAASAQAQEVTDVYKALGVKYKRSLRPSPIMGYYIPAGDKIYLMKDGEYESSGDFNHIALHELGHWARNRLRLGPVGARADSPVYVEEITVDLAAQILTEELDMKGQEVGVVADYLNSQLQGEKLSRRDWRQIHGEVQKTVEFILQRPVSVDKVNDLFQRLGLPTKT